LLKCRALRIAAENNVLDVQVGHVVVEEVGPVAFILPLVCFEIAQIGCFRLHQDFGINVEYVAPIGVDIRCIIAINSGGPFNYAAISQQA
jgi:hypothetical protein